MTAAQGLFPFAGRHAGRGDQGAGGLVDAALAAVGTAAQAVADAPPEEQRAKQQRNKAADQGFDHAARAPAAAAAGRAIQRFLRRRAIFGERLGNPFDHTLRARQGAGVKIALLEMGQHVELDHIFGGDVVILAIARAQFNPHVAVLGQDQHQNAVIALSIADAPGVEQAGGEIFQPAAGGVGLARVKGQNGHFDPALFAQGLHKGADTGLGLGVQHLGVIVHIGVFPGREALCPGEAGQQKGQYSKNTEHQISPESSSKTVGIIMTSSRVQSNCPTVTRMTKAPSWVVWVR